MAGPALQLFPPPPRPRQASPTQRMRGKTPTPEPEPERMESAKTNRAPENFHELIIQVNSVPVSPSNSMAPPSSIAPPPQAHLPVRTPPEDNRPVFDSPPRPRHASPVLERKSSRRGAQPMSPIFPIQDAQDRSATPTFAPGPGRTVSPAFSTSPTLVRGNSVATHARTVSLQSEVPMRSMFPVYNPNVSLEQQQYVPSQASPTHIPKNQISRSPYSPEFYIPHGHMASEGTKSPPPKPFFTPSHLLDNLWVACNGQEEPAVQMYTLRMHRPTAANPTITFGTTPSLPFYSVGLSNLAGNNEVQSIMNEVLIQRHHPTQPRVLPIAQLDLMAPPSLGNNSIHPLQHEATTLLTSIYPKLAALAALEAAATSPRASHIALNDPDASSPAAQQLAEEVLMGAAQRECCALAWVRDSPEQHSNPWARHMPSEGSYQLHHPTLGTFPIKVEGDCSGINKPSSRPVTGMYGHNMPSTPNITQKPASITLLNPYILSPNSPRAAQFSPLTPPPRIGGFGQDMRPNSITPSEMDVTQLPTATDATADDAMLARLDFASNSLTLNLGALTRFGNPFLVDVAASSILAVAVAEAVRGRKTNRGSQDSFEPPPPSAVLNRTEPSTAKAFKDSFTEGFDSFGGKTRNPLSSITSGGGGGGRKWSFKSTNTSKTSDSFDKDIELGEWYGQQPQNKDSTKAPAKETRAEKKARKKKEEEDKLPFVARAVINVLTFAFKSVIFVLKIAIKIVAGVVVMITRNFSKL
ncbi:hypothetical protein BU24DRAFT_81606 [Aaosphaeria arxii CBS 175.79]|uniref:Uncharacterized protein n=1 Tax=Aaosphaeria arxii CBS 175.79 TaxID=1450172 RepID=A0A6A5XA71_9PLEO|nr:uncharacterized protein BU24DRAFT_81606 [Aaosphaeria arxii CBS 175.79]KAF2009756.1 hypothetical protein BU24DRAFT_81606 [Aaosphaeria arxii CBS 175.79]